MKRRRHTGQDAGGVAMGLIITPMLDMSFQILSFFIMTYNPSSLEGHINGNLVPPTKAKISSANPTKVEMELLADSEPELENTLQVIVKTVKKGELKENERYDGQPTVIFVKKPEDTDKELVADSDEELAVSLRKLRDRLKAALSGGTMKGNVRLDCDADLKHRYVMQVYDVCKEAGFQNVAFVAPVPDQGQPKKQ